MMKTLLYCLLMSILCDAERCDVCGMVTIEGNDELGRCIGCAGDTSLDRMLKLMASGITRDRKSGRFTKIKKG